MNKSKYIGDKAFYKWILAIAVPIMVQNGITNFVSLLDNIMVGMVGTEQMSGVAIVNQIFMVFNVTIFGIVSGAGIFGAQFFGSGNHDGVRYTFRFKVISCVIFTVFVIAIFFGFGENLITMFLHGKGNEAQLAATRNYAREYMLVRLLGLLPFALEQAYASTLRECSETVVPMKAGMVAVFVNAIFDCILIFGLFGFPALGVVGAAAATVLARYVEFGIVVFWTHNNRKKHPFIESVYKGFYIPGGLVKKIFIKGTPLVANEFFWSGGMAILMQCYSIRGLAAVAGLNISMTIGNVFNVVFMALGSASTIIIGQLLGAGKMEKAKETASRLMVFAVGSCVLLGMILALISPFFPMIYNTTDEIRNLASQLIRVVALCMPIIAFVNVAYFILRSGGKTIITFLFDSMFVWAVSIPIAFTLSRYTSLPIVALYFFCQIADSIKCIIGYILLKKGVWIQNIIEE